tara:strand:+ start:69 stop:530 length:462 start_codon:yes stop_codon:yes gene_type:complete
VKILVFGLPGSGKTYLSKRLQPLLKCAWFNADEIRNMTNDWDFSVSGRKRQSLRMKTFANFEKSNGRCVICDFVCPTESTRKIFDPDYTIWMNTISEGRFLDTNKIFEKPKNVNYEVKTWNRENQNIIAKEILKNVQLEKTYGSNVRKMAALA